MTRPPLIIQELSIYKMPGFPRGMESMKSLAANMNIIAGPNASGKSSIARIIRQMIWKQNIHNIHVECRLVINDKVWDIKIDNGHYSCQCNGVEDSLLSLPAYDESKRYFLALHELIKDNDEDLANQIMREAIGGYDLHMAHDVLGFKATIPNLGLTEFKSFEIERKKIIEIEKKQTDLQQEEKKLTRLYEEYREAKNASNLVQLYECVIDFLVAKKKFEDQKAQQSSYPQQLTKLIGNEYAEVSRLEKEIDETDQRIRKIEGDIVEKKSDLLSLQLPVEGIDKVVLNTLRENIDKLDILERNLEHSRLALFKCESETNIVLNGLFTDLKAEDLAKLDLANVHDLDEFFSEAHALLGEKKTLEYKIKHLNKDKKEALHSVETLDAGIRILSIWFVKGTPSSTSSISELWVLFGIAIITFPLTFYIGWIGLIGVLAMLVYSLLISLNSKKDNLRRTREEDYKKTGLREPFLWQEEHVSKRLEELHKELQEVKQQNEISRQLIDLHESLITLQPEIVALESKRCCWIDILSDFPELTVENIEKYSGLYWFLKNLQEWQKQNNKLQAERLSHEKENETFLKILARINLLLTEFHAPASNVQESKAILNKLQNDENRRDAFVREIKGLDVQYAEQQRLRIKDVESLKSIYANLNLVFGSNDELKLFLAQKDEYDLFQKDFEQAGRRLIEKETLLHNHAFFIEVKKALSTSTLKIKEAEERKERFTDLANKTESLNTLIAKIETNIGREKQGCELEDALTKKDLALDNLELNYHNTVTAVTGNMIVNSLKKETQEQNRSRVFIRANQLFNRITHGRYELILNGNKGDGFKARDTVLNLGQKLDNLSSGTRIQLLLAVRLAFIESQEQGVKIPILADEVLANSDDLRAQQIIEALIEISKDGRQVFYFTAQKDELKKWQEHMALNPDLQSTINILKGNADEQVNYHSTPQVYKPSLHLDTVIPPGSHSNEEYHKLLNPRKYNLLKDRPEQLYLSYLIEDNELLHVCLQRSIQCYGQLQSFLKHDGKLESVVDSLLKNINLKVELLNFYQTQYKKGRPIPIDRQVLVDSGSVSAKFIDQVDSKLKELNNNPEKLIKSLKEGNVLRFNKSKAEELEEYLFEHNYLDKNEALSPEELHIQTHAVLSNMDLPLLEAHMFLNRIMN